MTQGLILVSHVLCPYVQRAAIVLMEKELPFERRWIDLADKPAWFRAISPLGKTPVLLTGDVPLFESAVICEYLDEIAGPRLHPEAPVERARHRAWMEFGSGVLNTIAAFYSAPDASALQSRREALAALFARIEAELDAEGPWFAGTQFGLVDAVFAPVFRYFDVFEALGERDFFVATPKVLAWRAALAARPSVREAAPADYPVLLERFLRAKGSELARRIPAH